MKRQPLIAQSLAEKPPSSWGSMVLSPPVLPRAAHPAWGWIQGNKGAAHPWFPSWAQQCPQLTIASPAQLRESSWGTTILCLLVAGRVTLTVPYTVQLLVWKSPLMWALYLGPSWDKWEKRCRYSLVQTKDLWFNKPALLKPKAELKQDFSTL